MLIVGLLLTCSTMPVREYDLNPCRLPSSLYGPIGRFVSVYAPVLSVTTVRLKPVSTWVAVTSAPGITPPWLSLTVPDTCADPRCALAPAPMRHRRRTPPASPRGTRGDSPPFRDAGGYTELR